MDCNTIAALLARVEAGTTTAADEPTLDTLARQNLVARGTSNSAGAGDEARAALRSLTEKQAALRTLAGSVTPAELAKLDVDLRDLEWAIRAARTKVLATPATTTPWTLTFQGRDLLGELTTRADRLYGVPLEAFQAEMTRLRSAIAAVVTKASNILTKTSPAVPWVEEAHCRTAAIGLGCVESLDATALGTRWIEVVTGLRTSVGLQRDVGVIAEQLVLSGGSINQFEAFLATVRPLARDDDDAIDCATIGWRTLETDRNALFERVQRARPFTQRGATAFIIADAAVEVAPLSGLVTAILTAGGDTDEAEVAAAFLLASKAPLPVATARFAEHFAWMRAFTPTGSTTLAGMVSLIDAAPAGVLDDLRLVNTEIGRAKLAVDGVETLVLGVKLLLGLGGGRGWLLQSASDVRPPTGALLPLVAVAPFAVPAISTFQRRSVHRAILFRPSHSHGSSG